jgi:hypothetical protein
MGSLTVLTTSARAVRRNPSLKEGVNTETKRHRDTKKAGGYLAGFLCVSVPLCLCVYTPY